MEELIDWMEAADAYMDHVGTERMPSDVKKYNIILRDALEKVGAFLKTRARANEEMELPRYKPLYDEIERIDAALKEK